MYDICIVGGGASGMATAISATSLNKNLNILLVDKNPVLGKKIYATGNGRCNISNMSCDHMEFVLDFFSHVGIITREEEEGRLYPMSGKADDVVAALEDKLYKNNINVMVNQSLNEVAYLEDGFLLDNKIKCKKLVIAMGGKAAPQFGTIGDGFRILKKLGHTINKPFPILTPVESKDVKGLKGVRAKGEISLYKKNEKIFMEEGEIQFTEDGISGICVFNMSRFLKLDKETRFKDYKVFIDFLPDMEKKEVEIILVKRKADGLDLMRTLVDNRLANFIKGNGMKDNNEIEKLVCGLKSLELSVSGAKGWDKAQCTSGGVSLSEVNMETLESKIIKNLYIVGEVLDYDGPCGGYNLHNSWETGIKAGRNLALKND